MLEQRNNINMNKPPIHLSQAINNSGNMQQNIQQNIQGQHNIQGQQNMQGQQSMPTLQTIVSNNMLPPNPQNLTPPPQTYGPSSRT
jgi:hypothetical protein